MVAFCRLEKVNDAENNKVAVLENLICYRKTVSSISSLTI